jgi:LmbE family N-acetylglucosaminyl deacetylase
MKNGLDFLKINLDWDIDHVRPDLSFAMDGEDIVLSVHPDHRKHRRFAPEDRAILRFKRASLMREGAPSEQDWRKGACRYQKKAIDWGHVYEVMGNDERRLWPKDWVPAKGKPVFSRHFLIYMKHATFECIAESCLVEPVAANALFAKPAKEVPEILKSAPSTVLALPKQQSWADKLAMRLRRALPAGH